MSRIAVHSVQTLARPVTVRAAAPAAAPAKGLETPAAAPSQAAAPAVSSRNTKAPALPAVSSTLMSALIEVQAKVAPIATGLGATAEQVLQSMVQTSPDHSTSPAPAHGAGHSSDRADHGANSGHPGHVDPGDDGDHHDRGWHGKPPVAPPPPAPTPQPGPTPAAIPNFDPSLPARAIAQVAKTLADGRAADAARTAFVTASVERRAEAFVAQGEVALAVFKGMQAQYAAWQDQQPGAGARLRPLYA